MTPLALNYALDPTLAGIFSDGVITGLFMFLVATFLGLELITKVPQMLHTPLMSGANAISGITILAAIEATNGDHFTLALLMAFLATFFATVNVVGGFAVTDRMLGMFKTKK